MFEFPRLGSSPRGRASVFAVPLKEDYARLVGVPLEDANFVVDAVGAIIQDRLLRGLPSGIPFVGVIHVRFQRDRKFHVGTIAHHPNYPDKNAKQITYPVFSSPALYVSRVIKDVIRDSAPYTGHLTDMFSGARTHADELRSIGRLRKKAFRKRVSTYVHVTSDKAKERIRRTKRKKKREAARKARKREGVRR